MPSTLAVFAKRDCPTCELVAPVMGALAARDPAFKVYSQDDPAFPEQVASVEDDRELAAAWAQSAYDAALRAQEAKDRHASAPPWRKT